MGTSDFTILPLMEVSVKSGEGHYHVGLVLEQQGLERDALQVWEDALKQADSASVIERPMLNKIRQRIAQLRAHLKG
jgi:hypothetical protein